MNDHNCPRISYRPGCLAPIHDGSIPCWVCDIEARRRYARWMPLLPGLYEWMDGHDPGQKVRYALYEHFMEDMPYGTAKARDGDPDNWLSDHADRVEELIATIEYWCVIPVS